MQKAAVIFPGQGSQKVGMGLGFYETSTASRKIFDEAESIMGEGFRSVVFNGPVEKLTATAYCQPAILTMSVAALKAFEEHPHSQQFLMHSTAGLSLGEYSALVAAGALSFADALQLVRKRANFMEEAAKLEAGKMAAVIGFDKDRLQAICVTAGAEVANFNSPDQIVITGKASAVDLACQMIREAGAKMVIPLEVSGAFHSSLMQPAAVRFRQELSQTVFSPPQIPVLSNVTAQLQQDPVVIRENLAQQITASVQWEASVTFMIQQGVDCFLEIGPGKVLKGLLRRINPDLKCYNIENPQDLIAMGE